MQIGLRRFLLPLALLSALSSGVRAQIQGADGLTYSQRRTNWLNSVPAPSGALIQDDRRQYLFAWLEKGLWDSVVQTAFQELYSTSVWWTAGATDAQMWTVSALLKYGPTYGTGLIPQSEEDAALAQYAFWASKQRCFNGNPNKNMLSAVGYYLYGYYFAPTGTVLYDASAWGDTTSNWPTFTYNSITYKVGQTYNLRDLMKAYMQWRMQDFYIGGVREFDSLVYHSFFINTMVVLRELSAETALRTKGEMCAILALLDLALDTSGSNTAGTLGRTDYNKKSRWPISSLYNYFGMTESTRQSDRHLRVFTWQPPDVVIDAVVWNDEAANYTLWHEENHAYDGQSSLKNNPGFGKWTFHSNMGYAIGANVGQNESGWCATVKKSGQTDQYIRFWVNSKSTEPSSSSETNWIGHVGRQFGRFLFEWGSNNIWSFASGNDWELQETQSGVNFYKEGNVFVAIQTSGSSAGVEMASTQDYASYSAFKTAVLANASISANSFTTSTGITISKTDTVGYIAKNDQSFPFPRMRTIDSVDGTILDWNTTTDVLTLNKHGRSLTMDFKNWTINGGGGPPSNPPVIQTIGNKTITEGDTLAFTVTATDDNSTPSLTAQGLCCGMTFVDNGDGTGSFSWNTQAGDAGTYVVTFVATDADNQTASEQVTITVNAPTPQPPPPPPPPGSNTTIKTFIFSFRKETPPWWYARFDFVDTPARDADSNFVKAIKALNPNTVVAGSDDWNGGDPFMNPPSLTNPPAPDSFKTPQVGGAWLNLYNNSAAFTMNMTTFGGHVNGAQYWQAVPGQEMANRSSKFFEVRMTHGFWIGYPRELDVSGTTIDLDKTGVDDRTEHGTQWLADLWGAGTNAIIDSLNTLDGNQPLVINAGRLYFQGETKAGATLNINLSNHNGMLIENKGSIPSIKFWTDKYQRFMDQARSPHYFLVDGNGSSLTDYQHMRFLLCATLYGDGYFSFTENDKHHYHGYYDEYDVPLGNPTDVMQLIRSTGQNGLGVYGRPFQNGLVIWNADTSNNLVTDTDLQAIVGYAGPYYFFKGGQDSVRNPGGTFSSITLLGSADANGWPNGDGVILTNTPVTMVSDIIVDNSRPSTSPGSDSVSFVGTWTQTNSATNQYTLASGKSYQKDIAWSNSAGATARFSPSIGHAGEYKVYMWWGDVTGQAEATNSQVTVSYNGGSSVLSIDQSVNIGQWNLLGTWQFKQGNYVELATTGANGIVVADAVRFEHTGNTVVQPPNVSASQRLINLISD